MSLRGINCLNPHCTQQASPITPQILSRIHAILDHNHRAHATMFCLFSIAFYSLSRKSNLVVTGIKFDANKQLCRSDIKVGYQRIAYHFSLDQNNPIWSKCFKGSIGCHATIMPLPP